MEKSQLESNEIPTVTQDMIDALAAQYIPFQPINYTNQLIDTYAELLKITEVNISEYKEEENKQRAANYAQQKEKIKLLCDLVNDRSVYIDALKNSVQHQKDCNETQCLQHILTNELSDLKQKYGENVLETSENILKHYMDVFHFKIIQILDMNEYLRVVIQFLIDGKLISQFPVQMDIEKKSNKIIDIKTQIYPPDKLMVWLEKRKEVSVLE
ncbi:uncharacterized protein [Atheta coriaria]|uniref:uncharacterized protein n=1 Tax=Dalotia coriaria TaxID=877792 RepID=UPI0031F40F3F